MIMSSAIPVTPGVSRKMLLSFLWKKHPEQWWNPLEVESIGTFQCLEPWPLVSLNLDVIPTIQYPLLKSAIVNLVIPWNFPSISLILHVSYGCLSKASFKSLGSRQILSFLEIIVLQRMGVAGIPWNFLFHDYKAVDPFSHILHRFKNFKLFQIPDFFVESILQMNWNLPWCMSCVFCICFELELVRFTRTLSNSSESVRVDIKDSCFHQWSSLYLILLDAGFLESVCLIISVPLFPQWIHESPCNFAFLWGNCRLCGFCFWISAELTGISCRFHRVTRFDHT